MPAEAEAAQSRKMPNMRIGNAAISATGLWSDQYPRFGFNVPSPYNRWWDNDHWRRLFDPEVAYGDDADGLTISFEPVPPG
jgi:hypothetical protein